MGNFTHIPGLGFAKSRPAAHNQPHGLPPSNLWTSSLLPWLAAHGMPRYVSLWALWDLWDSRWMMVSIFFLNRFNPSHLYNTLFHFGERAVKLVVGHGPAFSQILTIKEPLVSSLKLNEFLRYSHQTSLFLLQHSFTSWGKHFCEFNSKCTSK